MMPTPTALFMIAYARIRSGRSSTSFSANEQQSTGQQCARVQRPFRLAGQPTYPARRDQTLSPDPPMNCVCLVGYEDAGAA